MQNGEYYWVRTSLPELVFKFGSEWQAGMIDPADSDLLWLIGSTATWAIEQWEIGPKVIGHDELIVPARPAVEAQENLRDRFAMAALGALDGSMSPEDTADAAWEYADAMLAARSKLKS